MPDTVAVQVDSIALEGFLTIPADARGLVVFAHGSGSSRFSERNQAVARTLQRGGLATLLFDLLTPSEARVDAVTRGYRFDIPRLADRVVGAVDWAARRPDTSDLAIGTFGSSTGAAAALIVAAERPGRVRAVVSRGGRVDLAESVLDRVRAPTLCIVGELDATVLELNRRAIARVPAETRIDIVPGATHLFEEPGALDLVAAHARDWFVAHLGTTHASAGAKETGWKE